jgi:hypothetical protein
MSLLFSNSGLSMMPKLFSRASCALVLKATLLACAVVVLPAGAQPSPTGKTERIWDAPEEYATRLPVMVQGEGPWYRLPLPIALRWLAAHPDLRDLRVFNAEGEALAYGFVEAGARQERESREQAVKWFPLRGPADDAAKLPGISVQRSGDGTLIQVSPEAAPSGKTVLRGWLLDTSGITAPMHKLHLDWEGSAEGFQRFRIEASDDLQQWRSWGDGQVARLAFAGERIERHDVELPGARARYLRLMWESPQEAPELKAAVLSSTRSNQVVPPLDWSDMIQARRDGDTYQVSLPKSLVLERVRVSLYQPNTLAPATLSTLDAGVSGGRRDGRRPPSWDTVGSGLLYRLVQDGKEIRNDEIELPGTAVKELKLQVDPRGGGLGDAISFRVAARGVELVFLARGTPPYTLAMGRDGVQSAQLPLGMLVPGYEPARLLKMGVAQATAPTAPPIVTPAPVVPHSWKKFGLWAVLLLGVGLLGLMAMNLLKTQRKAAEKGADTGTDKP